MRSSVTSALVILPMVLNLSSLAAPSDSTSKGLAVKSTPSLDNVVYLSKQQLFQMFHDLASGQYGWPGDGKHPPIPIYQAAKNAAQLRWQVGEYNRMLRMAQEDIRMSLQVDEHFNKNSQFFNDASARGDLKSMKALTLESRDITKQMFKYGYDQESHMFKALGLRRALDLSPHFAHDYHEGERAVDYMHSSNLVQKTNANELRFAESSSRSVGDTTVTSQDTPTVQPTPRDPLPSFPPDADVSSMPPVPAPYIPPPDSPVRRAWRPKGPTVTVRNYKLILPPGGITSSLMRFDKIIDRHIKLHPEVIASVVVAHGWVNWVRVVDAQRNSSVAYPYTVNAEVQVSYPADPTSGEMVSYTTLERPSFQVNPKTGEVGGQSEF